MITTTSDDDDVRLLGLTFGVLRRLWALEHTLESGSKRMLREIGLTAQQRFALRLIGRFPGITPTRLSSLLQIDPGTLSAKLRRLEHRKLVTRRRDDRDQRRVLLGLTSAGRALDSPAERTIERGIDRVLARLPPIDVATTDRVLRAITDEIRKTFGA